MNVTASRSAVASPQGIDPRFSVPERLFYVIGAQKSGTSWMYRYFRSHPEICIASTKETNFWKIVEKGGPFNSRQVRILRRMALLGPLRPWGMKLLSARSLQLLKVAEIGARLRDAIDPPHTAYADQLFSSLAPGHRIAGECAPEYGQLTGETYARMAALNSDVRFVYLLRNPVDRYLSSIRQEIKQAIGPERVDAGAILGFLKRSLARPKTYIDRMTHYEVTFAELERAVPKDRIRSYFYETMFDQAVIDDLTAYLGVCSHPAKLDSVVNPAAGGEIEIPMDMIEAIAGRLAPTYRAMKERFGGALPESWQVSAELAERAAARGNG